MRTTSRLYHQILPLLSIVLILWIDLGSDIAPGISIVFKYAELDIMVRHQRNAKWYNISNSKIIRCSYVDDAALLGPSHPDIKDKTVSLTSLKNGIVLTISEFFHALL